MEKVENEFNLKKRNALKNVHKTFGTDLKAPEPGKFYKMCKKVGAADDMNSGSLKIKCLEGLSDKECAEEVVGHFASISNEYKPVNLCALPAYLPTLPPPRYRSMRCTPR